MDRFCKAEIFVLASWIVKGDVSGLVGRQRSKGGRLTHLHQTQVPRGRCR